MPRGGGGGGAAPRYVALARTLGASTNWAEFDKTPIHYGNTMHASRDVYSLSSREYQHWQHTDTGKHTDSGRKENHDHRMQQLQDNSPAPVVCNSTRVGAIIGYTKRELRSKIRV